MKTSEWMLESWMKKEKQRNEGVRVLMSCAVCCTSWNGKRNLLTWMNKKSTASILTRVNEIACFFFRLSFGNITWELTFSSFVFPSLAWTFSLFILSKPLMKIWNAMLGWRVDVPAVDWVLQTLLFAKGFLCLINPWESGPGYTWY